MRRFLSCSLLVAGSVLSVATSPPPAAPMDTVSAEVTGPETTVEAGSPVTHTLVVRASEDATQALNALTVTFSAAGLDGERSITADLSGGHEVTIEVPEEEVWSSMVSFGSVLAGCTDPNADAPEGVWEADGTCVVEVPLTFSTDDIGGDDPVIVEWDASITVSVPEGELTSGIVVEVSVL